MTTNIDAILSRLALRRPVFHSEADFQHALAWEIQRSEPDADVRLELPVDSGEQRIHVDARVVSGGRTMFLELKYKTRFDVVEHNGERFHLKEHSAQDIGRYDYVGDVCRLERLVDAHSGSRGCAILLTNDPSYWLDSRQTRAQDAAFRLSEGRQLCGELTWAAHAGAGSTKNREAPHRLRSDYTAAWRDYAHPGGLANRPFRALVFHVGAA